jgi:hypothetical protein
VNRESPERTAIFREADGEVPEKTLTAILRAEPAEADPMLFPAKPELGRVVNDQDTLLSTRPMHGCVGMSCENLIGIDSRVVKEPIRSFERCDGTRLLRKA